MKKRRRRRKSKQAAAAAADDSSDEETAVSSAASEATSKWPSCRMNAMLAVKGNILYVYGGQYEIGDREIALSDFHALDVTKLAQ